MAPRDIDALTRRAWTLLEAGQVDDALARFDEAIAASPSPDLRLERGVAAFKAGRPEAALVDFEAVLAEAPEHPIALHNRAKLLTLLGRHKDALRAWDRAQSVGGPSVKIHLGRALAFEGLALFEEGLKEAERAAAMDPKSPDAAHGLGRALWRLRRLDEALAAIDRALTDRPRFFEAQRDRARVLRELGRLGEAMQTLVTVQQLRPDDVDSCIELAELLVRDGRYHEATGVAEKALSLDQRCAPAWRIKGHAYLGLRHRAAGLVCFGMADAMDGDDTAALRQLDEALALDPRLGHAWSNKGIILSRLGRYEEAIAAFDAALARDPRATPVWENKGRLLLEHLDREDEALACFKELIRLDPSRYFQLPSAARAQLTPP